MKKEYSIKGGTQVQEVIVSRTSTFRKCNVKKKILFIFVYSGPTNFQLQADHVLEFEMPCLEVTESYDSSVLLDPLKLNWVIWQFSSSRSFETLQLDWTFWWRRNRTIRPCCSDKWWWPRRDIYLFQDIQISEEVHSPYVLWPKVLSCSLLHFFQSRLLYLTMFSLIGYIQEWCWWLFCVIVPFCININDNKFFIWWAMYRVLQGPVGACTN